MSDTGMWKREGHESCLAQIATLRADLAKAREEVERLTRLNTEIHEAKDAVAEQLRAAVYQQSAHALDGKGEGK